jgi:hypothetical protein
MFPNHSGSGLWQGRLRLPNCSLRFLGMPSSPSAPREIWSADLPHWLAPKRDSALILSTLRGTLDWKDVQADGKSSYRRLIKSNATPERRHRKAGDWEHAWARSNQVPRQNGGTKGLEVGNTLGLDQIKCHARTAAQKGWRLGTCLGSIKSSATPERPLRRAGGWEHAWEVVIKHNPGTRRFKRNGGLRREGQAALPWGSPRSPPF